MRPFLSSFLRLDEGVLPVTGNVVSKLNKSTCGVENYVFVLI